ncbi:MAG: polyprenyl synthetase family protein [Bacteroidaceae bacterium]|nr:polyprenyl synthetase family protein [Bacteroidaceae bacterium]
MKTYNELLALFNKALASMPLDRRPVGLYEPVRYELSLGGKRVRPVLMLMTYNLYRDDVETIMPVALGLETYHNYTLLHDDVMDNADMRRGKPTVHKVWNENAAILSGDSMLVLAYRLVCQTDDRHLRPVLDLFTETALEIGEGQQYDLEFETRSDVAEEEYIEMIRLKTSVLLACAMKLGAILADAPGDDAGQLYKFGENLGLAFQLQDDLLDVYGDPLTFGKNIGGDILEGKKTFMLINALRQADEHQRAELERWLATPVDAGTIGASGCEGPRPTAAEKVAAVTALYDQIGVRGLAEAKISAYFDAAFANLDAVGLPPARKQALRDFALSLIGRKN